MWRHGRGARSFGAIVLVMAAVAMMGLMATACSGAGDKSVSAADCAALDQQLKASVAHVAVSDYKTLADIGEYVAWAKDGCPARLSAGDAQALVSRIDKTPTAAAPTQSVPGQVGMMHQVTPTLPATTSVGQVGSMHRVD